MKKSLLRYAVGKMMKQDEWANKYNPHNLFDVNQYDFDIKSEYLDALRKEWKWRADPFDEFDDYVDVSKYKDFDSYESDIEEYQEKKTQKDKYDPYDEFDVNPCDYDDEGEYLLVLKSKRKDKYDIGDEYTHIDPKDYDSASDYQEGIDEAKEQESWKEEYNSDDEFDVNLDDFDDKDEYLAALREQWKEEYDSFNEYDHIDPDDYDLASDYKEAIEQAEEQKSWKEEYDPNDEFYITPFDFENENEYLSALKKEWKDVYDILNEYNYVDPFIFDSVSDYKEAIEEAESHQSFIEKYPNLFFKTDPYDYDNKDDYLSALLNEAKEKIKKLYLFKNINRNDYA